MSINIKQSIMHKESLATLIVQTLEDNKAIDIINLDVTTLTDITDHMIICTATSTRHAAALADKVIRACKNAGNRPLGLEGIDQAEWVLIDLHDAIVHIMLSSVREFYSLEKLWSKSQSLRQIHED